MMRASVMSVPVSSPVMRPSRMTRTRSARMASSSTSEEMKMMPTPERASALMVPWISSRADIDATRRLVEDQQPDAGAQPARNQGLLLVPAGEAGDLRFDARGLDA